MLLSVEETMRLAKLRAGCEQCGGDADICATGTQCPHEDRICPDEECTGHRRLHGCKAWTHAGQVAAIPQPQQPWWELAA